MAECFADGHLRFLEGAWRDDNGDVVDVAPVVHSHWVHDSNNLYGCYRCGERETMSPKKLKKFCHECGARMDGE